MTDKSQKLPKAYCSHCGMDMHLTMRDADENMMFYERESTIPFAKKYNSETGKRQYCPYFKCRNYKDKKWYQFAGSPHDEYFLDEVWIEKEFGIWQKVED
jgi:hypothetical protein